MMKRRIAWLSCGVVLLSACGGAQSSSEQPEAQPVAVATVVVPANDAKQRDPNARRELDRKIAEQAGILGVLADAGAFGEGDAGSQLGAMWGDSIGDSFGAGGLGLSGIGRGGGGAGHGTIGLGSAGTIGKGGGGSGAGYGSGHGRLGGGRTTTGPRLTHGSANVMGALDKSVIRRVIRRHANQFRYCYQRRLIANPNLEGKVVTRFTISPSGNVAVAQDAGSTMPDADVKSCVTRVFKRMRFPQPKGGGLVIVTYPLTFVPSANSNPDAGAPDAGASDAAIGG